MSNLPKLVRDKIPEILANSGLRHDIEVLSKDDYIVALEGKLSEEVNEYFEARESEHGNVLEELVDIHEVLMALVGALGYTRNEFDTFSSRKRRDKGMFGDRILLKKIYEEEN